MPLLESESEQHFSRLVFQISNDVTVQIEAIVYSPTPVTVSNLYLVFIEGGDILKTALFALPVNVIQQVDFLSDFDAVEHTVVYQEIGQRDIPAYGI